MVQIDLSKIPEQAQIDLGVMAIMGTIEAMKSPEGRAAVEKGRQAYLRHLADEEKQGKT